MKDLYKNEIENLKYEIFEYENQLLDAYFEFKNENVEEVLVEIRAGK
jgi:protein subunit release factor A